MVDSQRQPSGINALLLRPFRLAAILAAVALTISLGFLAYTAWTSAQRVEPLERHLAHLQDLQQSSIDIQDILIRSFEERSPPKRDDIVRIRARLEKLLASKDDLHPQTPQRVRQALAFLQSDEGDVKAGLLAALSVIRQAMTAEGELQSQIVAATRRSAEAELTVASAAMLVTPLVAMLLLAFMRSRSFRSIERLSTLLENVGNLRFKSTAPVSDRDDPLAVVFDRYNDMAEKLRAAQREAAERTEDLENQVRAASEMLLSQQAELEQGARLAALGEFSAQLAHELRNPISGVSIALRNLETEIETDDHRERVALIADEMDRVTRLLNALLDKGRSSPETPARVDTRELVGDVVRLFSYQLPERIAVRSDVEARSCVLPRDTIRQVLINLLRNSRDALGDGSGDISVKMQRVGEMSKLTVSDNGPGYPDDLLSHGIRPFQSGKPTGTGLGMSVVQRLVHAAGGEIKLMRGADGGAVTVVTLPCRD